MTDGRPGEHKREDSGHHREGEERRRDRKMEDDEGFVLRRGEDNRGAQARLNDDENETRDRGEEDSPFAPSISPGKDRRDENEDPLDRGDCAVRPFNSNGGDAEVGDDLTVAQRPIRASGPGLGLRYDAPRDRQGERPDR